MKKMLNFNKINNNLISESLLFLSSINILAIYMYLRITKKQLNIPLIPQQIQEHHNMFLYFLFISGFMLVLLLLRTILNKNKNATKTGFFSRLLNTPKNKFYTYYSIIFEYLSPKYTQYLVTYTNKILFYGKFKNNTIILLAVCLPKLLILFVFIFELYFKSLHYYFFSLLLLAIPLFFRLVLLVYSDIHTQVLPQLNEVIERVPNPGKITIKTPEGEKTFTTIGYRFKSFEDDDPNANYDLDHFMTNFYNPMLFIEGHMTVRILPLYYKINNITMFVYTIIHLLGWIYLLFFN